MLEQAMKETGKGKKPKRERKPFADKSETSSKKGSFLNKGGAGAAPRDNRSREGGAAGFSGP